MWLVWLVCIAACSLAGRSLKLFARAIWDKVSAPLYMSIACLTGTPRKVRSQCRGKFTLCLPLGHQPMANFGGFGAAARGRSAMKLARWSLHTVISLALLGDVLGGTTSVGATTASQSAPTTAPCPTTSNGTVCIAQVSDDYTATTITLTLTVGAATDPTSDPNWANSGSLIKWALYTDGATTSSYSASESVSSGQFTGTVTSSSSSTVACDASSGVTTSVSTTANTYALSFPASCLGSPTSLTVQATWSYVDDGTTYSAAVPATGTAPCCSVTPDTHDHDWFFDNYNVVDDDDLYHDDYNSSLHKRRGHDDHHNGGRRCQ